MKLSAYIRLLALVSLSVQTGLAFKSDYGIGFVIPPGGDNMHVVIYSKRNEKSDTVAILRNREYTFRGSTGSVRAFLVGFRKYDSWGLPILTITHDSTWAQVSVESSDGVTRMTGWVNLRVPGTSIRIWADFLPTQTMVLLEGEFPRFYTHPNKDAGLHIKLFRFRSADQPSYILKPIRREGRWLLVELETPFLPCGDDDAIMRESGIQARRVNVWIQYLDERGRPLVRAPMMC
jgi:hypothetical protein